jgi:hypothetical protein
MSCVDWVLLLLAQDFPGKEKKAALGNCSKELLTTIGALI